MTRGGTAGIGLGHLQGGEHETILQSGVEDRCGIVTKENGASLEWIVVVHECDLNASVSTSAGVNYMHMLAEPHGTPPWLDPKKIRLGKENLFV